MSEHQHEWRYKQRTREGIPGILQQCATCVEQRLVSLDDGLADLEQELWATQAAVRTAEFKEQMLHISLGQERDGRRVAEEQLAQLKDEDVLARQLLMARVYLRQVRDLHQYEPGQLEEAGRVYSARQVYDVVLSITDFFNDYPGPDRYERPAAPTGKAASE